MINNHILEIIKYCLNFNYQNDLEALDLRDIDWENMLRIASEHNVLNNVAYMINELPVVMPDDFPYFREYQDYYMKSIAIHESQTIYTDIILGAFEEHNIAILPLKGINTKLRYPNPLLRSMGDLDFFYTSTDSRNVRCLMNDIGFNNFIEGRKHDFYRLYPYITVEMHRGLVAVNSKYEKACEKILSRIRKKKGFQYVYEMSIEDEYLFCIIHLAEHLLEGGAGIRFLMDVYVYEHQDLFQNKSLDREFIYKQLNDNGLLDFYKNIVAIANNWFSLEKKELNCIQKEMAEYIFNNSLFGSNENVAALSVNQGKLYSLFSFCFPGLRSMQSMFSWLSKYPFLLPVSWIIRIVRVLFLRRGNISKKWKKIISGDINKGKQLIAFYEKCGLYFYK